MNTINGPKQPNFGGVWSDKKLLALKRYLNAYTTALKNQPFKLVYIDAFAGYGQREINRTYPPSSQLLFYEVDEIDDQNEYLHGSPIVALENNPPFDQFVFIDENSGALKNLEEQILGKGYKQKNIDYIRGNANEKLIDICHQNWRKQRAVAFIDPFAMQVEWASVAAIAETKAIDMWLLVPVMAVNRMLTKHGHIETEWKSKLTKFFGDDSWNDSFYMQQTQLGIFLEQDVKVKIDKIFEKLAVYIRIRLSDIFPGVSQNPLILRNSRNSPLFFLFFACGNPKAVTLALKLANYIIDTSESL